MATTRIGFIADLHYPTPQAQGFIDDLTHLWTDLGCDMLIWGGDQMGGGVSTDAHFPASDVRDLWSSVEGVATAALDNSYSVPGNHDIPVPFYNRISNEFLDGREQTPMKLQPIDGLTCLLFSTQGGSAVDGGADGVGMDYPYVPQYEIEWLVNEAQAANTRGDITLLFGHTPMWYGTNSNAQSHHPKAGTFDFEGMSLNNTTGGGRNRSLYFTINNNYQLLRHLSQHTPMCYFFGDDLHGPPLNTPAEFHDNHNGFHQCFQDHYAIGSDLTTTSYIDVDTTTGNVTFTTVNSSVHPSATPEAQNEIMNITPTW